jgi:hypothetical protein
MAKLQEIVIHVTIETPESEPTGRIVKISPPVPNGLTRLKRYSTTKHEWQYLDEMHPCHLLNAFMKETEGFKASQILEDEYFKEMLRLLGEHAD